MPTTARPRGSARPGAPDAVFDARYRALSSRDSRFDGLFLAGVHSTGIYCRPSCAARTPLPSNVAFYRTAAAAHEAGLRACKRCQPDAVPGSPDWNLHDDLASRAMRLILDGLVEREGVPGLAARLGYSPRHLTRVLVAELGAGPLALARAHRAQTARDLLVSTDLTIADIAFAAGFSSIRQFNDTMLSVYDQSPRELRRRVMSGRPAAGTLSHGTTRTQGAAVTVSLRLPARAPFDGAGLFRFFADHAVPGLESGDGASFSRRLRLPRGFADVTITLDGERPGIRCSARLDAVADVAPLVARIRRMFDLDADSAAIDEALGADPQLATLVDARPGIRMPGVADLEEALFRTMIGQQISVASARTVLGRLVAELGEDGVFPSAARIAEDGPAVLSGPTSRTGAIVEVARRLAEGELVLDASAPLGESRTRLLALPGVGVWTAGYLAMRALGDPDTLLEGDLVIRRNAERLGLHANPRELAQHARRWSPWRSYVCLHLWRATPVVTP
ncbi:AlkA N-terminal domain-containing protein [Lysobacter korlensis]|uniref:DNA-3-methyladenine glycosylase II n=1 Tax=Lysobacter korlensis TaxID=553636 RepID=A0ABV6RZ02_9GAMM